MNEDRFTFTPADWGFDRYAPADVATLELRRVINALLTNCASAGRRLVAGDANAAADAAARDLADAMPQTIQFEGARRRSPRTSAPRARQSTTSLADLGAMPKLPWYAVVLAVARKGRHRLEVLLR